jgi:hypothetical protein
MVVPITTMALTLPGTKLPTPPVVILPGFGNADIDYVTPLGADESVGLKACLEKRGFDTVEVVPVDRADWLRVAGGLLDADFRAGEGTPDGRAFGWYLERTGEAVRKAKANAAAAGDTDARVLLVGHSAGGWLARAALGDGTPESSLARINAKEDVCGLVTLGTPHMPPPEDTEDSTRGVLRYVDKRYPGAALDGLAYVTVAGSAVTADKDAARGSLERVAANSYPLVSGPAAAEGGVGDSIVPLEAAHLPGAGVQRITLEEATHSIGSPESWYGSDAVVDDWLPQAQKAVAKGGGGLSGFQQIKKFGTAGTLAYILTELAFWVVAFPVAFTTYYQTFGHWPDFINVPDDRTAVLGFIFAGANIARLAVPLRLGAAFALVPWVDENIVKRFGVGGAEENEATQQ